MKLIPKWREGWRMYSVQALTALAALPLIWEQMPMDIKAIIPAEWNPYILAAIALAGVAGRLLDQTGEKP